LFLQEVIFDGWRVKPNFIILLNDKTGPIIGIKCINSICPQVVEKGCNLEEVAELT
jgi:hypothetical protein